MAWNPFDKSASAAPTTELPTVDVPVADATSIASTPVPQSESLRQAFEAAQREVAEAAPEAPAPAADAAAPAADVTPAAADAPAPLRLGGATRFDVASEPAASEPVTAAAEPVASAKADSADAAWASADATAVLPAEEPTQTMPAADRTVPVAAASAAVTAEQVSLERERAARREARMAALQPVTDEEPTARAAAPAASEKPVKHPTDRFLGSFGLFGLRLVTAAILFVHGLNGIINAKPVVDLWSNTVLPYPRYIALGVSIAEVALAILLVFGLLTRLAGLGLLAIMGVTLAFVMWGPWSVFEPGGLGFIGEHELLLGAVGLLFLFVGAGGWSVDYMVRRNRIREGLQH